MTRFKTFAMIIASLVIALAGPPAYAAPSPTPTPAASPGAAAIQAKYAAMGGNAGPLGFQMGNPRCGLRDGGCVGRYKLGYIAWSPATGAWAVVYYAAVSWERAGFQDGVIGYPTSDMNPAPADPSAMVQTFQGGEIWWAPGIWFVAGEAYTKWKSLDAAAGPLGGPQSDESCDRRGGGCVQRFKFGAIYRSPASGTHAVYRPYDAAYARAGGLDGSFGYPISDEVCGLRGGGCYQNFQGGAVLKSSDGTYFNRGAIRAEWAWLGFENGRLSYPTSDEVCGLRAGGCYQNFRGGAILWSPATGAHFNVGEIRAKYAQLRFETGRLGYPTSGEVCGLRGGGCYQNFQDGAILWSPATGAHTNWGAIRAKYAELGFENGRLGYPTTDEMCSGNSCQQRFQGGTLEWSPATGAYLR